MTRNESGWRLQHLWAYTAELVAILQPLSGMKHSRPNPLRIAYISTRPIPSRDTDTQQFVHTVDALAGCGMDVALFVPRPWRANRAGPGSYEAAVRAFYNVRHAFRLRPIRTVPPSRLSLERPLHALRVGLLQSRGYDIIHTRSRATVLLCALMGRPVVFETYRRLGHSSPVFARLLAAASRRRALLGIVTHSALSAASLVKAGIDADKVAVLHNGHDPSEFEPALTQVEAKEMLGLETVGGRPTVVYTGNVQQAKGLDSVLALADRVPEADFLIVGGKDADRARLLAVLARRRVPNVTSVGWRPARELAPYLYAADVLIIPPTSGPLQTSGRTVLPMKVFGYLAAGRPIFAPALEDIGEVLTDGVNACLTPPDDPETAAVRLRALLADPETAGQLGRNARATAAGLTWSARGHHLIGLYERWLTGFKRSSFGRSRSAPQVPR
jgi:glycosyltransferase involved in cell wall biosynthesis